MGRGNTLKGVIGAALMALLTLAAGMATAGGCREDVAHLRGPGGEAVFRVEIADTEALRAQGLMHRESLAPSAGMLFVYPAPRPVGFWMKNTLIPLDMIFMDATGTVRRIGHEAQPHDERPVMGGDGIQTVLEINGGLARRIGISEGWEMRHPAVDQEVAAWPCAAE
ncbi:MAG: DUF192 domain-containing protein [Roseovarius sp.]|nr:DUF192 domain-containing protein [Roseovarius sp.]